MAPQYSRPARSAGPSRLLSALLLERAPSPVDLLLLGLRFVTGAFLVWGVWDNIVSAVRMAEFVVFLDQTGFPTPSFWGPFTVFTQFAGGLCLLFGLLVRLNGIFILATFIVALAEVHFGQGFREWWPALSLVAMGAIFAVQGAGRYSVDHYLLTVRR